MPVAPVLWCTKYQTTSAQAELETTELHSKFNYLRFYIEGETDKYIELATTRPELSAACQCIIVHSDDEKNKYLLGEKVQVPLFGFSVPAFEDEKVEKDMPSKKCPCGCEDFVPEQDSMDTWAASSVTPLLNLDWYRDVLYKNNMISMSIRPNAQDIIQKFVLYGKIAMERCHDFWTCYGG